MPRRLWIHESNIVPATIVPEQTLVVEAQAFIDHTAELALYKRDNLSLKKQQKTDKKKIKSLEQQVKELTKERDDLKRMFEGSLDREHTYKEECNKLQEELDKAVRKGKSIITGILHYEKQLDHLVKLGYVIHYDKVRSDNSGKTRPDILTNTITNSDGDDYTIDELRKELQKMEKKIGVQQSVIKSLQGKKVEPIHKKCKKRDEDYKEQEKELLSKLSKLRSGEGLQVGESLIYNGTDTELSQENIDFVKKLVEKCMEKSN
jgi:chromosome segregation ATPase